MSLLLVRTVANIRLGSKHKLPRAKQRCAAVTPRPVKTLSGIESLFLISSNEQHSPSFRGTTEVAGSTEAPGFLVMRPLNVPNDVGNGWQTKMNNVLKEWLRTHRVN